MLERTIIGVKEELIGEASGAYKWLFGARCNYGSYCRICYWGVIGV